MHFKARFLLRAFCLSLVFLASTAVLAQAQPTTETAPSIEDFFSFPKLANVTLSPGGKYLAATSRMNDRMNVVVIELQTRKAQALTNFTDIDAMSVRGVGDEKILFTLGSYSDARMSSERTTGGGLPKADWGLSSASRISIICRA